MMQDEATQTAGNLPSSVKQTLLVSKAIQTNLQGHELESLREFHDQHSEAQSKFEGNLR